MKTKQSKILWCILLCILILCSSLSQSVLSIKNPSYNLGDGERKYWAIIAGYGANPHQIPCVNREIKKIERLLERNDWPDNQIKVLQNEQAKKDAILGLFDWLLVGGCDEDDVVFIFLSFHGSHKKDTHPLDEPNQLDGFLVPFDFEYEILGNGISDDEIGDALDKVLSRNIVVVIESCHAGEMIDGSADLCGDGRVVLTSCTENELSFFLYRRVIGLFPYYIIKGMQGFADTNKNGWISAEELYNYGNIRTTYQSYICSILMHFEQESQHPQLFDGWPSTKENSGELDFIKL